MLESHDSEHLWEEIKCINAHNKPVRVAATVDGKSVTNDISAMWEGNFQRLLNSDPSSSLNLPLHEYYFECFTPSENADVMSTLKNVKSSGVDQLVAEHVKHAYCWVLVLLPLLCNACIIHGFLPVGLNYPTRALPKHTFTLS